MARREKTEEQTEKQTKGVEEGEATDEMQKAGDIVWQEGGRELRNDACCKP